MVSVLGMVREPVSHCLAVSIKQGQLEFQIDAVFTTDKKNHLEVLLWNF